MSKITHLIKGTHVRRLTNCIQSINMSEDDKVSSHKQSNTIKSFYLLEIPNTDKNLATIIVFNNCNKAIVTKHITNCSFNNDPLGLLMNMTSLNNKHPLYVPGDTPICQSASLLME